MKAAILALGIARLEKVDALLENPAFRKATRNMALAYDAIDDLLQSIEPAWVSQHMESTALVLGTGQGELDATVRFLRELGQNNVARPFIFQNSLHNATVGFLTQKLGMRGPAMTVSNQFFSGEDALEIAMDLIYDGAVSHCLVVGMDGLVSGMGTQFREGAGSLLIGRSEVSLASLAVLEECRREETHPRTSQAREYDANAVECLAQALRGEMPTNLRLGKPDGSASFIRLSKDN